MKLVFLLFITYSLQNSSPRQMTCSYTDLDNFKIYVESITDLKAKHPDNISDGDLAFFDKDKPKMFRNSFIAQHDKDAQNPTEDYFEISESISYQFACQARSLASQNAEKYELWAKNMVFTNDDSFMMFKYQLIEKTSKKEINFKICAPYNNPQPKNPVAYPSFDQTSTECCSDQDSKLWPEICNYY